MKHPDIKILHHLVRDAQETVNRPFEVGETSRPYESFLDHLGDEGWRLGWSLVASLRNSHAGLFRVYTESRLHQAALNVLLESQRPLSVGEVANALQAAADDDGPVMVSVPLANVRVGQAWVPLSSSAVLWRSSDADPQAVEAAADDDDIEARFAVKRHLGDYISPATRVIRTGSGITTETGRTVSLLSVEAGPSELAVAAAQAKARYALAVWGTLSPPARWRLLPSLAVWSPQPFLHQQVEHKRTEPDGVSSSHRRGGGSYRRWSPYDLPDQAVLMAPFEAFASLEHRPAHALLSATLAFTTACRMADAPLSERIRDARAAIECLCEEHPGAPWAKHRWEAIAKRFDVWAAVKDNRAYSASAITQLQDRLGGVRNISAHGADAALIDLGWIAGDRAMRWGPAMPAGALSSNALQRDLSPMLHAVGEALRGAWEVTRSSGFDAGTFDRLFEP